MHPKGNNQGMSRAPGSAGALLAAVGNTPLVEIPVAGQGRRDVRLFAKLEGVNPGGSIKDRPVARMLVRALQAGRFTGGRRLLDSSSGNAGVSYAMFGAALGIPVTLVMPGNANRESLERIEAHGAELILTDPIEGSDHAITECRRLAAEEPDKYWHCDQYANGDNWRAHYDGTGSEILAQLGELGLGPPDILVAGIGTGGTLTGLGRRFRATNPQVHIAAVIPEAFPGIEGLKPIDGAVRWNPPLLDPSLIDSRINVTLAEAAAMSRRLATHGYFVGPSSGAYVVAAEELAATGHWRTLVTVLNDSGERYVSSGLWDMAVSHQDLRRSKRA